MGTWYFPATDLTNSCNTQHFRGEVFSIYLDEDIERILVLPTSLTNLFSMFPAVTVTLWGHFVLFGHWADNLSFHHCGRSERFKPLT